MKKIIFMLTAALTAITLSVLPVSAEKGLSKEEIKSAIWEDFWHGRDDNGTEFPEASYKYHLLDEWVEEHYADEIYSSIGEWNYSYKRYYSDLTEDWHFSDDRSGNWTITDEYGNVYSFTLSGGKWQQSNQNGDVTDSFPPYSTLDEDRPDILGVPDKSGAVVVKGTLPHTSKQGLSNGFSNSDSKLSSVSTETPQNADGERTEHTSTGSVSSVVYVIAIFIIVGSVTMVIFIKKRK